MPSHQRNTVVNGGIFNAAQGDIHQHQHTNGRKGMELLHNSIAPGAFHNSAERYDHPKCHPATRVALLEHIMKWINDLHTLYFFLWLHGPAGAGKSAIAQSIAERCHEAKILAASFFFSRTAEGRNDESRFIPTIVYQLCLSIPAIRKYVEDVLERDPLILSRSLEAQLRGLIVEPLNHAFLSGEGRGRSPWPVRRLIIIDGLDECGSGEVQRYILTVLAGAVKQLRFPILFLVASRPEQEIRVIFNSPLLAPTTTRLALDDSYPHDSDIEVFLKSKFDDIKKNHPLRELIPPWWPPTSQIQYLIQKSSGQFIYASTVMKYIASRQQQPTERLSIISGIANPGNDTPFAKLDALYLHIFSSVKDIDKVLKVLWALLLFANRPLGGMTPDFLEDLLFFQRGHLSLILSDLHSVIDVPPITLSQWRSVRILHASLGDFLLDKSRSKKVHIDAKYAHANLTRYLLRRISTADPSIQDSHRVAFHNGLIPQCLLAYPTNELLADLRIFDMLKFMNSTTISPFWIMAHLPPLFLWMKRQAGNRDANLYSHHLLSWDVYMKNMMSVLVNRSSELGLNFISSLVLPNFPTQTHNINDILVDGLNVAVIDDFVDTEDNTLRLISFRYDPNEFADYHLMISELLKDPLRSGVFYVDGDRFTILAKKFTEYVLRYPGPEKRAARTVWHYLPGCLTRSSPSKELATLLRRLKFPPTTSDEDRVMIKKVLDAINAYISRSFISEIPRNAIDISTILATLKPTHIL